MKKIISIILIQFMFAALAHAQRFEMMPEAPKQKVGEISLMGYYSKTTYGDDVYAITKRYTSAFGLKLTPLTEIEVAYTNSYYYFKQLSIQSVTVREQILSGSIVQGLVPPDWFFQPYAKAGGAQYNRRQNSVIVGSPTPEVYTKSPSLLLGGGFKFFVMQDLSLKTEVLMYFPDMKLQQGKNNFSVEAGLGIQL